MQLGRISPSYRVCGTTQFSNERKIRVYSAVVVTRLLYSLSSAWLNVAELRRLNGFHCRCLRRVLRIKPSFISRVSNSRVLQAADQIELGRQLLQQQLVLYGKVLRAPVTDPLRDLTFIPGTDMPAANMFVRRVGRPRNEWAEMLRRECHKMGEDSYRTVYTDSEWREAVHRYCNR